MPTHGIKIPPGVKAEYTSSFNETAWQSSNLIRWSPSGLPQKLGGWARFYSSAINSIVRALHAWEDLFGDSNLGIGAVHSLSILSNGLLLDVTPEISVRNIPISFTTTMGSATVIVNDTGIDPGAFDTLILLTPISVGGLILVGPYVVTLPLSANSYEITASSLATSSVTAGGSTAIFSTTSGVSSVQVTLDGHGYSVGSNFPILTPVSIAGLTLQGLYPVTTVVDANNFTISAQFVANATTSVTMNGGNALIDYYITPGPLPPYSGYGIGGYGDGGYGTGQAITPITGTPITVTDYTLDNWGEDLAACQDEGPIFIWQPATGLQVAQMIVTAPTANTGIFVSMPQQIMVAYGCSVLGVHDPLLVGWCNAGDFTDWTASTSNLAGTYRIPKGSLIVGGMQGPQYGLLWTDIDLWSMTYIGYPLVFGFNEVSTGCGLIGKFAAGILGTTVYWMSQKSFFMLPAGGGVVPLPCDVWDFIFQNLDTANVAKIRCTPNSQFQEISWFFPVANGSGENTAYVKYTPQFNAWDYGYMNRSAWIDQSVLGSPIGADPTTNLIQQHEISNDADGAVLSPSIVSGYFALSDAEDVMYVDTVLPDMKYGFSGQAQNAQPQISFSYTDYADGAPVYTYGPATMQSTGPQYLTPQFRGRLSSISVTSNDLGTWWRLGNIRIVSAPDGKL